MCCIESITLCLVIAAVAVTGCKTERLAIPDAGPPRSVEVAAPAPPDALAERVDATGATDATDVTDATGGKRAGKRRGPPAEAAEGGGGGLGFRVTGNLPKAESETYLRGRLGSLRACYAGKATEGAGPKRVEIKLEINDRGVVEVGEVVKSTLGGGDAEMCMVRATQNFKFPTPPGGGQSTVTFRLTF